MFFTLEKLEKQLKEIRDAIRRETRVIRSFKYLDGDCHGAEAVDFNDSGWKDFQVGETWGGYDRIAWFRAQVPVPPGWNEHKLALRFLVGPRDGGDSTAETLLYVNGEPLQAIDVWHEEAWLPPETLQSGEITIALKAWSGVLGVPDRRHFKLAQLVWIDPTVEKFYYQVDTLLRTMRVLDENDLRRTMMLQAANRAFYLIDFSKPGSEQFYQSLAAAQQFLAEQLEKWQHSEEMKPTVVGIGHSHLDMAWLWRVCHTREKAARTFSTVLHLMRQYPEYRFLHSSPQLYKFLEQDYPDIFNRVKERIARGDWEITGATWVEPDTNIPSGESLIRQFLYGLRYVRKTFGVDMKLLWLPDVFGYSYALPQIIRKSGIKYFMTTKISWSQFNRFPYDTFNWRGIDGSEVLTHFVTTPEKESWFYTYNGQTRPEDVKGIWDAYRQKDINDELLLTYGWGDGGGGPTQEMLEMAQAQKNLPGLPRLELGKAEPFFERLEKRVEDKELPLWDGELYLEYHRGTYTSQAATKRLNRKSEILFHNVEWMSALADILTGQNNYPAKSLSAAWEKILLNQFHDILPGSSIQQVYEDAQCDYAEIGEFGKRAIQQAQKTILERIATGKDSLVAFNPLSFERDEVIELPWTDELAGKTIIDPQGKALSTQLVECLGTRKLLCLAPKIPALGYQAYELTPVPASHVENNGLVISPNLMENRFYRIVLNAQGQISSIYDKEHKREVLHAGANANVFQAFEDKPMNFDAWDIDLYYQEKKTEINRLVEAVVEESGPVRGTLRLTWQFGDSTITQRVMLYAASRRIDFPTEVEWHQQQTLLKVAFPVEIRASRATYSIQFGSIERPTHWNTSWDWARFEVCAHKWADLSEGNYGVAFLNDCKYGYDIKDNVMRLTLIKSAIRPDAQADKGHHEFTYSLLPHAGEWRESELVQEAYALNNPAWGTYVPVNLEGELPDSYKFAKLDAEHVIIETIKQAEDDQAWILRLYESKQCRNHNVHLDFGMPIRKAVECNLVEDGSDPVDYEGSRITFSISPAEIKTFKVWF